ncbi:MAG TPA: YdbL family protein [Nitrospira sp.]|nr:YdbL family protein [Nitrospira sp.]
MGKASLMASAGIVVFSVSMLLPAFAISIEEAKAKGLVGERPNGYLGAVNPANPDAQALTNDVNQKRRQAYEDIAKRNRTSLDAVEALAGEKAIQNTRPGNFVEGPGGWMKKQ